MPTPPHVVSKSDEKHTYTSVFPLLCRPVPARNEHQMAFLQYLRQQWEANSTTALKKENLEFFVEECQTNKESLPRLFIRGPYGLLLDEEKCIHHGWI